MRFYPPHASKPAIDAAEIRQALIDVLRRAMAMIKPLFGIDATR
jgi:hypothetical protein